MSGITATIQWHKIQTTKEKLLKSKKKKLQKILKQFEEKENSLFQ